MGPEENNHVSVLVCSKNGQNLVHNSSKGQSVVKLQGKNNASAKATSVVTTKKASSKSKKKREKAKAKPTGSVAANKNGQKTTKASKTASKCPQALTTTVTSTSARPTTTATQSSSHAKGGTEGPLKVYASAKADKKLMKSYVLVSRRIVAVQSKKPDQNKESPQQTASTSTNVQKVEPSPTTTKKPQKKNANSKIVTTQDVFQMPTTSLNAKQNVQRTKTKNGNKRDKKALNSTAPAISRQTNKDFELMGIFLML